MKDAALRWLPQVYGHLKRPDGQVLLHPVADRPTHDTAALQIRNDGEIKPAFRRSHMSEVASPFVVRCIGDEVANEQVRRNPLAVVPVRRHLLFAGANGTDAVDPHQAADTPLANGETGLVQLHCLVRPAIAVKAQAVVLANMGQHFHVAARVPARRPRSPGSVVTCTDPHPPTHRLDLPKMSSDLHERKPHGRWPAKMWVAFLGYPSRPSARGSQGEDVRSRGQDLPAAPPPDQPAETSIPNSIASTAQRPNPTQQAAAKGAIRTASRLKSSVCFIISPASLVERSTLK